MDINSIQQAMIRQQQMQQQPTQASEGGASFADTLKDAIQSVENDIDSADRTAASYVAGEGDLHNAILAMEKADVSFQTLLQVRNRLLDAYREIMRMQV